MLLSNCILLMLLMKMDQLLVLDRRWQVPDSYLNIRLFVIQTT